MRSNECPSGYYWNRTKAICRMSVPTPSQTGRLRYHVLNLSIRPSVRPSVRPRVCSFFCYQTHKHDILKTNEPILMPIITSAWSTKQGQENINFGVTVIRGHWKWHQDQGHTTPKIGLEPWRRHHSRPDLTRPDPLGSNSFTSCSNSPMKMLYVNTGTE